MIDLKKVNTYSDDFCSYYINSDLLKRNININEVSKEFPFYGYVEIDNYDHKFMMFSNNDDYVAKHYYWLGKDSYESMSLKLWARLSKKAKIVFDIGAYTGLYSLLSATVNRKARVFSFEALERNYSRIIINKKVNGLHNIYPHNIALSDISGEVQFHISTGDDILTTGGSLHKRNKSFDKKVTVDTMSLDSFVKNNNIPETSLIKVDVEGAEYKLFKGMNDCLRDYSPHIICEFLNEETASKITLMLNNIGYNFYQINDIEMKIEKVEKIRCAKDSFTLNTFISKLTIQEIENLMEN